MTRLAAGNRELLREIVSLATGARVQLLQEQGSYRGARSYYIVAALKPTDRPTAIRHTPLFDRAEFLFERFAADVTDPVRLASGRRRSERKSFDEPVRVDEHPEN